MKNQEKNLNKNEDEKFIENFQVQESKEAGLSKKKCIKN